MNDEKQVEEECVVCESPTQSHNVPHGFVCHSCLTTLNEEDIFEELPVAPVHDFDADTTVTCYWCGNEHSINQSGDRVVDRLVEVPVFETLSTTVWIGCPSCTRVTEVLIDDNTATRLSDEFEKPIGAFGNHSRWSK